MTNDRMDALLNTTKLHDELGPDGVSLVEALMLLARTDRPAYRKVREMIWDLIEADAARNEMQISLPRRVTRDVR